MAAARGRKRTDDTTPNRARDIQRAFRARRAAHLESLEERILELEDENNYFRALLNLPPSNRPALGKGPTGRGLAKSRARSTVGNQGDDHLKSVSSSPTPPSSDSPSTPTMECPVPLPAPDAFSLDMPNDQDGDHVPSFGYHSDEKMDSLGIDQYSYPIQRHNSIAEGVLPLHDYDRVGLNQGIPPMDPGLGQGLINDYVWGGVPHVAVTGDLPTPTTQRAFSFTQQIAPPTIPRQSTPAHLRAPQGHRRSNTEPHSLGSLITAYNPAHHRSSSSDAGGYGSPSPPPLISRGGYAVY